METKSKVGLLVLGAAVVAVAGLIVYSIFGGDKLRPATPDEVAKHLQGEWSGVSVDRWQHHWDIFKTYGALQGNRFEGKGGVRAKTQCPKYIMAGSVEGNRISEVHTHIDIPDGAPTRCRRQRHAKHEMKIGEDGTPHLIGSWDSGEISGASELTKVR